VLVGRFIFKNRGFVYQNARFFSIKTTFVLEKISVILRGCFLVENLGLKIKSAFDFIHSSACFVRRKGYKKGYKIIYK
jgi:hypothetical protein